MSFWNMSLINCYDRSRLHYSNLQLSFIKALIKKQSTWSVDYDNLSRILYRIISFKLKSFVGYLLAAMSQQEMQ